MNSGTTVADKIALRIRHNQKGYFSTLGISITNRCTLNCAHCIRGSTAHSSQMDTKILSDIIDGIPYVKRLVNQVAITGGEPFLFKEAIHRITEAARSSEIKTSVVTSAYWARTPVAAIETVRSFPWIDKFSISTDLYHQSKVPLSTIRRAYEAARAEGRLVRICVTANSKKSEEEKAMLAGISEFADDADIRVQELLPWGRAIDKYSGPTSSMVPPIPCISTGPFINEFGVIYPCCGPLVTVPSRTALQETLDYSLYNSLNRVKINPLFHFLRIWGFGPLFERLSDAGFSSLLPREHLPVTPCSTCAALFSIDEINEYLLGLSKDYEFLLEVVAGSVHIMEDNILLDAYFPCEERLAK